MLIADLNQIKGAIVYRRLYLAAKYQSSGFLKFFYQHHISKLAVCESQISWVQQKLSFVTSLACSLLIDWDDFSESERRELQVSLRQVVKDVSLSTIIINCLASRPTLQRLDPNFFKNSADTGRILSDLEIHKSCLEFYSTRLIQADFPGISVDLLQERIAKLKALDGSDIGSLNAIVYLLGRDDAFDFRKAQGVTWIKGRLN